MRSLHFQREGSRPGNRMNRMYRHACRLWGEGTEKHIVQVGGKLRSKHHSWWCCNVAVLEYVSKWIPSRPIELRTYCFVMILVWSSFKLHSIFLGDIWSRDSQRRLRGAVKEDLANEERGALGGTSTEVIDKIKDFFTNSNVKERSKELTQKMLKKVKAIYKKHRQNPPLQYMVRNWMLLHKNQRKRWECINSIFNALVFNIIHKDTVYYTLLI